MFRWLTERIVLSVGSRIEVAAFLVVSVTKSGNLASLPQRRRSTPTGATAERLDARVYKLAWSHQAPFVVIGSDGGLLTFSEHPGLYRYHCHILEHEDMSMMRNLRIRV